MAAFVCRLSDVASSVAMNHVLHQHPFTPCDQLPNSDVSIFRALAIPEEILPIEVGDQFRHRMGTKPLEAAQWLPSDEETAPTIAMKRELLRNRRNEVVGLLEGGDDAAEEVREQHRERVFDDRHRAGPVRGEAGRWRRTPADSFASVAASSGSTGAWPRSDAP